MIALKLKSNLGDASSSITGRFVFVWKLFALFTYIDFEES